VSVIRIWIRGLNLARHPQTPHDVEVSEARRRYAYAAIGGSLILGLSALL
jgi:hypothetical protein